MEVVTITIDSQIIFMSNTGKRKIIEEWTPVDQAEEIAGRQFRGMARL